MYETHLGCLNFINTDRPYFVLILSIRKKYKKKDKDMLPLKDFTSRVL